jgi:ACR3 family arsenite efflux pump ArsB
MLSTLSRFKNRSQGSLCPLTLLSTIVLIFALNAKAFTSLAKDAVLIAIPLTLYLNLETAVEDDILTQSSE